MAVASQQLEALVGPKQDTLNQAWKQDKSSFGFKMLMKMGWSEGKGLGKELQGAATHVTVAKKTDSAGLGTVKDETGNLGWTETSAAFDSVLSRLNARYGNDAAAAAAATKAEKKRKKKRKKKEKKEKERAEQQGVVAGKASMLLRHPKLLKSKNIRAYSAHDMKAILGVSHRSSASETATITTTSSSTAAGDAWSALAAVSSTTMTTTTTTTTTTVVRAEEEEEGRKGKKKDKKKRKQEEAVVVEGGEDGARKKSKKEKKKRKEKE